MYTPTLLPGTFVWYLVCKKEKAQHSMAWHGRVLLV